MIIETNFTVNAPVQRVWEFLLDVEEVVTCVPGAEILAKVSEDEYEGQVTLKVGPLGLNLHGTAVIESRDVATKTITLSGKGKDKQGKGAANVLVVARISDAGDSTSQVAIEQDLRVTGRIAQFGRGVMKDVSARLSQDFARRLEAKIAAGTSETPASAVQPEAVQPVGGLTLLFWAMSRAVGRFFRRLAGRKPTTR
jgi:hypothetical protein